MFSNIKRVDIEFHSKCNRKCDWCPNKFLDRISDDKFLDLNIYRQLLQDLHDNGLGASAEKRSKSFGCAISFLGYQEPFLAIDKLNEYLKIAKEIFYDRNIKYLIHSNGDFITSENLSSLTLNELDIMDYDCKGQEYWKQWLKDHQCCLISVEGNRLIAIHNSINIIQIFLNWPKYAKLEDRGGSLNKENVSKNMIWKNDLNIRTVPCYEATNYLNIYHDGSVMPCCHLRPDNLNHQDFIMGNLHDFSIKDIFTNEKFQQFRENTSQSIFPNPCKHCHKTRREIIQGKKEILKAQRDISLCPQSNNNQNSLQYFRANEVWTPLQEKVWQNLQPYYYRFELNNKKYPKSYYFSMDMLFNVKLVKNLYDVYNFNLEVLKTAYEYKYVTLENSVLVDHHGGIGFENFSFTADSMAEEFCKDKGFFQPFFANKYYKPGAWAVCAGRHRLIALQLLQSNKIHHNISVLCLLLDAKTQKSLNITIKFPKNLYPLIQDLNLITNSCDSDNFYLTITNYADNWICLKILERELDFIIEFYHQDLINNKITPSETINQIVEKTYDV